MNTPGLTLQYTLRNTGWECPLCAALVYSTVVHTQWHESLTGHRHGYRWETYDHQGKPVVHHTGDSTTTTSL